MPRRKVTATRRGEGEDGHTEEADWTSSSEESTSEDEEGGEQAELDLAGGGEVSMGG